MNQLAQAELSQSQTESTQPPTGGNPVQALFDKQRAYFATDVTKTYEWRIDQLDRLIGMLKDNFARFSDAARNDFKTLPRRTSSRCRLLSQAPNTPSLSSKTG